MIARTAQQELKIARDNLEAAGPDYQGHRHRALKEIRRGLDVSRGEGGAKRAPGHRNEPAEQPDD